MALQSEADFGRAPFRIRPLSLPRCSLFFLPCGVRSGSFGKRGLASRRQRRYPPRCHKVPTLLFPASLQVERVGMRPSRYVCTSPSFTQGRQRRCEKRRSRHSSYRGPHRGFCSQNGVRRALHVRRPELLWAFGDGLPPSTQGGLLLSGGYAFFQQLRALKN